MLTKINENSCNSILSHSKVKFQNVTFTIHNLEWLIIIKKNSFWFLRLKTKPAETLVCIFFFGFDNLTQECNVNQIRSFL
jgi:hypothetical protein